MKWKASPPRIETAAVSVAAACLGGAVGFAVKGLLPLAAGPIEASVAGLLAALVGLALVGRVDRQPGLRFVSVPSPNAEVADEAVLLLDQRVDDEPLLLVEALPDLNDEMRVVRLFAPDPARAESAEALAGPAEMIARIEDFLGQPRVPAAIVESKRGTGRAAAEDANAALHVALADIRRSLRQA